MLNIVSFWVPRPDHPKTRDYQGCLVLQHEACERLGLRHRVITEPGSGLVGPEAFEAPIAGLDLMRACLVGQRDFLASPAFDADTVLVGADCLPLYDPSPVFDGGFDIAVTTHPFADCILNTGAIFCPVAARDILVRIWDAAIELVGDQWGDDQLALAAVLQATLDHGDHQRDGFRLRCLPVPTYNEAPASPTDPIKPLIAHFRGPRKDWMAKWWKRHLKTA